MERLIKLFGCIWVSFNLNICCVNVGLQKPGFFSNAMTPVSAGARRITSTRSVLFRRLYCAENPAENTRSSESGDYAMEIDSRRTIYTKNLTTNSVQCNI